MGEFLQSPEWRKFQESAGHKAYSLSGLNVIEHRLPIVRRYFYLPKSPIMAPADLIKLAKENNSGWVRFDPESKEALEKLKSQIKYKIVKAPHDMQPRQIFVLDITKPEGQLLAEMKAKARYNIKVAQKHGVEVAVRNDQDSVNDFLRLTKIMARRQRIKPHPDNYYQKMLAAIPPEILKLYVGVYENRIIAANLMVFYGDAATYLHGASDDKYRNVMAPYLLHWQAIKDAKAAGFKKYDFGGVDPIKWPGVTKFKLGFAPNIQPVEFPGSYDIILSSAKYWTYRFIQKLKSFIC